MASMTSNTSMTSTSSTDVDCVICESKVNQLLKCDACFQKCCSQCFSKWKVQNASCPFCRAEIKKDWTSPAGFAKRTAEQWPVSIDNVEQKMRFILANLPKIYDWIPVSLNEFKLIQPHLVTDGYQEAIIPRPQNRACLCSNKTGESPSFWGTNLVMIIDRQSKYYYEYYNCSQCVSLDPISIWKTMTRHENYIYGITTMREFRDLLAKGGIKSSQIESLIIKTQVVQDGYLKYLDPARMSFLHDLINLYADKNSYDKVDILHLLFKYIALPIDQTINIYFSKFFFTPAWTIATTKTSGFLGLYPILTLWQITRSDKCKEITSYDAICKFFDEWRKDIMESPITDS